jgi:hypothetical protein
MLIYYTEMRNTQERYLVRPETELQLEQDPEHLLGSQDTICESKLFRECHSQNPFIEKCFESEVFSSTAPLFSSFPTETRAVEEHLPPALPRKISISDPSVSPKREPPVTPTKPESICLSPARRPSFGRENIQPNLNGVTVGLLTRLKTPSPQKPHASLELTKDSPPESSPGGSLRDRMKRLAALGIQ